jgi:nuclear transport factor 2 (NTF2) superfamily protein
MRDSPVPQELQARNRCVSQAQTDKRAGLSADQRALGVRGNHIAVRCACEWHDDSGNWFRSYGNENWEFDENGLMSLRLASINGLPIKETQRKYYWALGRRPDDHPGLNDLGL